MQKYTLIGHPLGHSMSPFIHSQLFRISNIQAEYDCTDIPNENFSSAAVSLRQLCGYNITIPYKRDIIPFIDILDESAKRYSAVNCVHNTNGKSIGYNTDCDGFLRSVKSMPLSGKVMIIGCGGVGRMIAIEATRHHADLTLAIIPEARAAADTLCDEIHALYSDSQIKITDINNVSDSYDLIINASPVGMYPKTNACPVSREVIQKCGSVFDVVYNPVETMLLKTARELGKPASGGTAMLVYQAVMAHEIWHDAHYSDDQINAIIEKTNKIIAGDFK